MIKELVQEPAKLSSLLERLDKVKRSGKGYTARCPAHDDRVNSLSVTQAEDGRILIKCHAGCATRDVLEAVGWTYADLFPKKAPRQIFHLRKHASDIAKVYPYVDENGALLFEVVRTEPKGFFQRRPDGNGGYVNGLGDVRRVLYRLDRVAKAVAAGQPVLLCEGEKDADAVNALGLSVCATTAPMGAGKWQEGYTAALAGARVIICPDNDDAGYGHLRACGEVLRAAGCDVRVAEVVKADSSLKEKKGADISDYLARANDPAAAMTALLECAEPFSQAAFEGADAYILGAFLEEAARVRRSPAISTGFASLDKQLGGRLYAGLYVLGAGSGMGKTALALQIALRIAEQGRKVLFFSLEMSRAEMAARALVGLSFQKDPVRYGALRANDLLYEGDALADAEIAALARCAALRNLSFVEGDHYFSAGDIERRVLEHRRAFGEAPAVFVDYLQILSGPGGGVGEKQTVDVSTLALKRLSREMDAPIFAVSSFNRQSYASSASFAAFKESGAIEYTADVVLALQANGVSAACDTASSDPSREIERLNARIRGGDVRPLELVTLKNRRGIGYGRFRLDFYAGSFFFAEEG